MTDIVVAARPVALPGKSRLMRYAKIIGASIAFTYALCLLLVYSVQNYAIFPGQLAQGFVPPFQAGAGVVPISLATPDGEHLFGLYKPPAPGGGVVVTFHGNGGFPEQHASRFQTGPWAEHGWGFICVTYRGFSRSSGRPSEAAAVRDADAVVAYVHEHAPGAAILFHGHSLGAAVATAAAAANPGVGLYLEAPFVSMAAMARLRFPMFPTGLLLADTFRSDLRISKVSGPIVIVHGRDDDIVPFGSGEALAAAAGERARFIPLPGGHIGILGKSDAELEAMFRAKLRPER